MIEVTHKMSATGPETRLGYRTYEQIKDRLLNGRYAGGERLAIDRFTAEFGVSKQPVMEALHRLSGDGLVQIKPQVGCQVATYTADEAADFFTLFSGIEAAIAEVAAARRTDAQLERLAAVSHQIRSLSDDPDRRTQAHTYRVRNREFHAVVHDMAHSRIMAETSRRMWDLCDFLITTTGLSRPLHAAIEDRHADHERIRDALARGDAAAARREMGEHILAAGTDTGVS